MKSNGPANRDVRHFMRNPNTGLLEDRTVDVRNSGRNAVQQSRHEYVFQFIRVRENEGRYVTLSSSVDGLWKQVEQAPIEDINAANLKGIGKTTIENCARKLMEDNRIGSYKRTAQGSRKWLGVVGGILNREEDDLINGDRYE